MTARVSGGPVSATQAPVQVPAIVQPSATP
jgi:hypothetical protein